MPSNCVIWAIWQRITRGGHIRVSRSPDYPMLPRVRWSQDGLRWFRYHPVSPPVGRFRTLRACLFRGRVIRHFD